jgi:phosphoglycolate phosphatase-like HAD superfamily hydrolase
VGDRLRDIAAAGRAGGRGLLVLAAAPAGEAEAASAQGWPVVPDLAAAVSAILADAE